MNEKIYRRVLRRETHRPRTALAVVIALIAVAAAVGVAWLAIDATARDELRGAIAGGDPVVAASVIAVAAAVIALALLLAAVLPGGRHRRGLVRGRLGVVCDDVVIANGVADRIARECLLERARIRALVERRRVIVRVTPTSGVPVDDESILRAATGALNDAQIALRPVVHVSEKGVIA